MGKWSSPRYARSSVYRLPVPINLKGAPSVHDLSQPPHDFVTGLFVFLLATLLGLEVIRRVSPLLHTPLMSLTNAISAISVIVAIELAGNGTWIGEVFGGLAVVAAATNIVGGFLITDRMLRMFKSRGARK